MNDDHGKGPGTFRENKLHVCVLFQATWKTRLRPGIISNCSSLLTFHMVDGGTGIGVRAIFCSGGGGR